MKYTITQLPQKTECDPMGNLVKGTDETGKEVELCFSDLAYKGYAHAVVGDIVEI